MKNLNVPLRRLHLIHIILFLFFNFKSNRSEELDESSEILDESMYDGDNITEFLNLCLFDPSEVNNSDVDQVLRYRMDPTTGEIKEPDPCPTLDTGLDGITDPDEIYDRHKERFKDLRKAQDIIKSFKNRLEFGLEEYIYFGLLGVILLLLIYLLSVKHFRFKTIYNIYQHDPTTGIPCWQYVRMKYIAAPLKYKAGDRHIMTVPVPDSSLLIEARPEKEKKKKRKKPSVEQESEAEV